MFFFQTATNYNLQNYQKRAAGVPLFAMHTMTTFF